MLAAITSASSIEASITLLISLSTSAMPSAAPRLIETVTALASAEMIASSQAWTVTSPKARTSV